MLCLQTSLILLQAVATRVCKPYGEWVEAVGADNFVVIRNKDKTTHIVKKN